MFDFVVVRIIFRVFDFAFDVDVECGEIGGICDC